MKLNPLVAALAVGFGAIRGGRMTQILRTKIKITLALSATGLLWGCGGG